MITLATPVTITPNPFTMPDGTLFSPPAITLSELDYDVKYSNTRQVARANFVGLPFGITLWKGVDYVAIGQFTDADVEARIKAILGNDPQSVLQGLWPKQA
jgi:hypothetical protein